MPSTRYKSSSCFWFCKFWTMKKARRESEGNQEFYENNSSDHYEKETSKEIGSLGSSKDGLPVNPPCYVNGSKFGRFWGRGLLGLRQTCVAQSIEVLENFKLPKKYCSNEKDKRHRIKKGTKSDAGEWNPHRKKEVDSYLEFEINEGKLAGSRKQEIATEGIECVGEKLHDMDISAPFYLKPKHLNFDKSDGYIIPAPTDSPHKDPPPESVGHPFSFDGCTSQDQSLQANLQAGPKHTENPGQPDSICSGSPSSFTMNPIERRSFSSPPHSHAMRRLEDDFEKCSFSLETPKVSVTSPTKASRGNGSLSIERLSLTGSEDLGQDASKLFESTAFRHGKLTYGVSEELLWFSFYLDGSEEVLTAQTTKPGILESEGMFEPIITFSSCKEKIKGKAGWKSWLKTKKNRITTLGNMEVKSRFQSEIGYQGKSERCLELQFVLLSADVKEYHSWGRISGRSALLFQKSSSCPGSPIFHKSTKEENFADPILPVLRRKMLMINPELDLPLKFGKGSSYLPPSIRPYGSYHADNLQNARSHFVDKGEPGICQKMELLAMVISVPIKRQPRSTSESLETPCSDNRHVKLTVILPAGEHGCPGRGSAGPHPLIQRWRSDGKCDCGSWDLGCGLVLLSNEQAQDSVSTIETTHNNLQQDKEDETYVEMLVQGKKQMVAMRLSHHKDDLFSLSFREPLTSLKAFATAVAIFYGKLETILLTRKMNELKDQKPKPPSADSISMGMSESAIMDLQRNSFTPYSHRSCNRYSPDCHQDPTLNPAERI
ncbi:hypothetical protein O6H91_07G001300 [Diphasiastrum complanatum]|uniref:Uncharacterized protein n=4 Tax=Diphasiastrum complanatum TaxID=34168 RepID=A0ACC2D215_DIPCM|nr:hypothetical protein O6H91_07G001300 [Diphasiastrum complanatum]KAJ7548181.1 hypothetical protein O6H91_07G001300 [Diphasiastrum complanatum]KAJ7548182.1 hypothetical protein O6H91_07G001300 [Diphasiastrum complanatum]KAJ7548183.1 hypothetical protein O6H91_07G001300 [Diphasiastrum complanatum]